jgi:hypothetical protein
MELGFAPNGDYSVRSRLLTELRTYAQPYLLPDDRDTLDVARNRPYLSNDVLLHQLYLARILAPQRSRRILQGTYAAPAQVTLPTYRQGRHTRAAHNQDLSVVLLHRGFPRSSSCHHFQPVSHKSWYGGCYQRPYTHAHEQVRPN